MHKQKEKTVALLQNVGRSCQLIRATVILTDATWQYSTGRVCPLSLEVPCTLEYYCFWVVNYDLLVNYDIITPCVDFLLLIFTIFQVCYVCSHLHRLIVLIFYNTVNGLARLWMQGMPRKRIDPRTFKLPDDHSQLKSFIEKYDKSQQQLQTLAAVDDLLSG